MIKPVLLGEAPAQKLKHRYLYPLSGSTATRLCLLANLSPSYSAETAYGSLCREFTPMNAIERFEDAYPWRAATTKRAQRRWTRFLLDLHEDPVYQDEKLTVVCLGRHAAEAAGMRRTPWFEWLDVGLLRICAIPHPSGMNRMYNDDEVVRQASRVLREAREP